MKWKLEINKLINNLDKRLKEPKLSRTAKLECIGLKRVLKSYIKQIDEMI